MRGSPSRDESRPVAFQARRFRPRPRLESGLVSGPTRSGVDFNATPRPREPRKLKDFKCIACGRELPAFEPRTELLTSNRSGESAFIDYFNCPFCDEFIALMRYRARFDTSPTRRMILPIDRGRRALPKGIPEHIVAEYREASAILELSTRASAAMSRRCLQSLLAAVGAKAESLDKAIDEVIEGGELPKLLAEELDAVREIGNFGAHPRKSEVTGAVLDVESGEAEWNLEVLEHLFDFYYLDRLAQRARREALNQKLREAGRPPLDPNAGA